MSDLDKILADLQEAFAPVFDKQRETWEREGPAAKAALAATGAILTSIGGNCPVQAYGIVDEKAFYFRARGDEWQFHVAETAAQIFGEDIFYHEAEYGDGPYDAGWMPEHVALGFIVAAIAKFRAAQGIEAAAADETRSGSAVGESPVAEGHAPTPSPSNTGEQSS